jgi:hypothetical protein
MTDTTMYDTINNLPDLSFIGGTDKTLTFTAYSDNGIDLLNISSGSVTWFLCAYGQFSPNVLEIAGVITDANHFTVTIPATSTLSLSGKFIQQVSITDFSGKTFRPGQGIVIISPAIPT